MLDEPTYCLWNAFDLAGHRRRMRQRHPSWSDRRLCCCLYWQNTARRHLRQRVNSFLAQHLGLLAIYCPEACGVDVTATMAALGIWLEWPPSSLAYQVALLGTPQAKLVQRYPAFATCAGLSG